MNLTHEQKEIIETDLKIGQSLSIEAGAGTGKTTCFIEYSKKRPASKILYLCFNNKAAREAQEKYKLCGVTNTQTSTIHGLASNVKNKYTQAKKFTPKISIKDIEKHFGYSPKLSWLVLETVKNFCYSKDPSITPQHIPKIIDNKSKASVILIKEAARVWAKMVDTKDRTPVSYDQYLKIYQLSKPKLKYDYILLDEAQDSNPLTLEILNYQKENTRILIIGDENQAIYGWRGAKNAMQTWEATSKLKLTESFRFGKSIAFIANRVLSAYPEGTPRIKGVKPHDKVVLKSKESPQHNVAFISRTNASLFEKAIELQSKGIKCHFVGTEEASQWDPTVPYRLNELKDVYRLWTGDINKIESPLLKIFKDYHELKKIASGGTKRRNPTPNQSPWGPQNPNQSSNQSSNQDYSKFEGDRELEFLCRMVEKYKHNLPDIIQTIKDQACGPTPESNTENTKIATLCTAHRSKVLEWDNVEIADDFIDISKINTDNPNDLNENTNIDTLFNKAQSSAASIDSEENLAYNSYVEEINLLYVACTRAKKELYLNQCLSKICIKKNLNFENKFNKTEDKINTNKSAPYLDYTELTI